jgi:hypothetical protein
MITDRVSELPEAEFKDLLAAYLDDDRGDAPSLADALEIVRQDLSDLLHGSRPPDAWRGELATIVDIATCALVMDRAEKR